MRATAVAGALGLAVAIGTAAPGEPVARLVGLRWLSCAAFSPDGRLVAVGTNEAVVLYDTGGWEEAGRLRFPDTNVFSLAFSPDGALLAAGGMNELRVWAVGTGELLFTLRGPWGMVSAVRLAPDALLVGTADGALRLWPLGADAPRWQKTPHTVPLREIVLSLDGALAATSGIDRAVLWDTATWEEVASFPDKAWDVAFTPDGYFLVVGSGKVLRLRDTAVGFLYRELWGHESCAVTVAVSPDDGALLASGSLDETARVWDPEAGVCLAVLAGHDAVLAEVTFSPDGTLLLTASDNGVVQVWDVAALVGER